MNVRSLFVCNGLLLFATVVYGAGSYQRTRDGKTLVWNDAPKPNEEATWSGKRDKNGFAIGSGTLSWYKVEPAIITGSHIPDPRRHAVVISRFSGKMVQGKFRGAVTYIDVSGERFPLTLARTPSGTAMAKQAPIQRETTATPIPERTPSPAPPPPPPTPPPTSQQSPLPAAQQTAVPQQATTPAPEQIATVKSTPTPVLEHEAGEPDAQNAIAPTPTSPDDSLRSPAAPLASPKQPVAATSPKTTLPSPTPNPGAVLDAQAVAALDTVYQAAVKDNDVAIMDRILADDFVLVTGRGTSLSKADLIKQAREKRTIYEHQEEEEGTQKVRVWGDTAVVTALLRVKGTRDQHPFDYEVWFSSTYARTPTGWRHIFGDASIPLSKPDTK